LRSPIFQLRQHLFGLQDFLLLALVVETGVEHRIVGIEHRRLLQIPRADAVAPDDVARVAPLLARQDGKQRRLARTVAGDEPHALPLSYRKTDGVQQQQTAEGFGQMLYVENRIHAIEK